MTPLAVTIRRLAEQGYTAIEAAELAGTTARSARMILSRQGYRFLATGCLTAWRVSNAAAEGLIPTEIAKAVGMERSACHRVMLKYRIRSATRFSRVAAAKAAAAEARAAEEALRMARWREAWVARKAAKAAASAPRPFVTDEASLGAAMLAAARAERDARRSA